MSWEVERDCNGRIFIDRDGDLFSFILHYLRTGQLSFVESDRHRGLLIIEAEFYRLADLVRLLKDSNKRNDDFLRLEIKRLEEIVNNLNNKVKRLDEVELHNLNLNQTN